jgi:predicted nucleotidyltransferase
MTLDIELIKRKVAEWAKSETLINKVYIFGSRARDNYREYSDLDIAIEINKLPYDENVLSTWVNEKKGLERRLFQLLPSLKLQLELLDAEQTPTVLSGIQKSSILVYP